MQHEWTVGLGADLYAYRFQPRCTCGWVGDWHEDRVSRDVRNAPKHSNRFAEMDAVAQAQDHVRACLKT